jgi:hypothetical protein
VITNPDPRSRTAAVRIVGYSPAPGFVITMIALGIEGQWWGVAAWKTTGAERRNYQETQAMTTGSEAEIDARLVATAAEYVEEDRAAAAEESHDAANSAVFSVRLSPAVYDAVRQAAVRAHLTPSALIRQWVSERVADTSTGDLASAVAALRRDVERLARLTPPA